MQPVLAGRLATFIMRVGVYQPRTLGTGTYNPFFEAQVTPADAVAESLDLRVKKPIRED